MATVNVSTQTHPEVVELNLLAHQAFRFLQFVFVVAPLMAGVDKFLNVLTNWSMYLTPMVPQLTGISAQHFMMGVGVIEIFAAVLVAFKPKIGSAIVATWLALIITNLLLVQGFYDVALRDLGLCLAALALNRLSCIFDQS